MAGGQPGSSSRGRGGKFRKFTRGGGKHFSRDLRPLDADGNEISMWSADTKKDDSGSDEDDSEEESEEETDSDDAKPQAEQSRADRKAAAKARKEAAIAKKKGQAVEVGDLPPSDSEEESDDDMPANPNHSKAARNQTKAPPKEVEEATEGVKKLAVANNRKERESMEAALAKERYRKLHEAGKTDEAKADMARLRLIREQRAADAARREAEKEEREAQEAAKRAEIEKKEAKKREAALGPAAKKGKKSSK
ncbi:28 kDa heat- and acid-stable phosphoprotein [Colletotrichum siamense]|uniref:28 kDa heat- and acid-stable phosphoprotein n=1 Tax=Colletotrichum siamense TaxID=690259 RepID=A0A9P5BQR7_COLSI|nr:28 kDa heat- and acid-stable phosphoprotein [Colletotrichum siamense]KAI8162346.1 28 kDa heat- and acid-stable phosphoprotein [Colletotrichum sp. SAR 10_71]KAI8178742.1 28 kDa heat- and acid-stable phosphoprotein [Colletotrichum sp. SAR 10_70]KAI8184603.1 28 kDa heat- and acid-stable phosphoprotein [Colletotrichum sp. SAR 10_65]KAI8186650.1 28 kDa heat- and acid-stable phosphoprotein [Colletotrichum sp. SAR 10_75]KAI8209765.1 28 kDa heat- and acid-stable phosphoprotein [Colletotrichum sp. S